MAFTFNGVSSDDFDIMTTKVERSILPPKEARMIAPPGFPGAYYFRSETGIRTFRVLCDLIGDFTLEEFEQRLREIAEWLDTDTPAPLVFDFEPDKTYSAVFDGESGIDRIGTFGQFAITFLCPYPYAIGDEEFSQIITDRGAAEITQSREDWATGSLDNVEATENGLQLELEGNSISGLADWSAGVHDQTRIDPDGNLALEYAVHEEQEETFSDSADGWQGGNNDGVVVENGELVMTGFPAWSYADDMTDYFGTGWDPRINPDQVTQTAQTVGLVSDVGEGTAVALVKETTDTIRTIEVLYRLVLRTGQSGAPSGRMILSLDEVWPTDPDRWVGFRVEFSPTEGRYLWLRAVIKRMPSEEDNGEAEVYINGEFHETVAAYGTTLSPRIQFILENEDQGALNIADVKYSPDLLPNSPFPRIAHRESPEYDLSDLSEYRDSTITIDWDANYALPIYGEEWEQRMTFEIDVFKNGSWLGYREVSNGDSIPHLSEGEPLEGVKVRMRYTFQTYTDYKSPILREVAITVDGFKSEYYTSGTWTSPPVPLEEVGIAQAAELIFSVSTPENTAAIAEIAIEDNGTLGDWEEVSSGDLPQLVGVNLAGKQLYYRFRLSTADIGATPTVSNAEYSLTTAYKPEGYRISGGVPIDGLETVDESFISWLDDPDGSVEVSIQLVPTGSEPQPDQWVTATNGGPIPGIDGTNPSGKTLYTRQRLTSDGTLTPRISSLEWRLVQFGETDMEYEGTAPGYPILRIEVQAETSSIQVRHVTSGHYILLEHEFKAGDSVEIDCIRNSVKLNGAYNMPILNIKSRFFRLQKGANSFITEPAGAAQVELSWRERWK